MSAARTVHRHKLDHGINRLRVPMGWRFLSTAVRPLEAEPSVWLEVPGGSGVPMETLVLEFIGTGHIVPGNAAEFLGTAIVPIASPLVWHVYRIEEDR
jgi:hypothetical protein